MKRYALVGTLMLFVSLAVWHVVLLEQRHSPSSLILLTINSYLLAVVMPFAARATRT